MPDKLALNLKYLETISFRGDLQLLLSTFLASCIAHTALIRYVIAHPLAMSWATWSAGVAYKKDIDDMRE
jgi:hypothetical protein